MDLRTIFPNEEQRQEFRVFQDLSTEEEKNEFFSEREEDFARKTEEEKEIYRQGFLASGVALREKMQDLIQEIREIKMKEKLGEVPEIISLNYVAKKYFNKSRGWLHQRLNGYLVNGKPASFTDEEKKILASALVDIADKIKKTSLSLC
jgi:actin-related protein